MHYHLMTSHQCLTVTIHRFDLLHVFTVWIYYFMDFMINYSNCSLCCKWRETFMMWVPFWRSVRITWWITMMKMFLTVNRHLRRRCLYNTYTSWNDIKIIFACVLTWEYTLPAGNETSGGTFFTSDAWCTNDISDWVLNNTELPITLKCICNIFMLYMSSF